MSLQAQHLTRVHHKNLVSMIGYCRDGDQLALVYEFMSEGTLEKHLKGSIFFFFKLQNDEYIRHASELAPHVA